MANYELRPLSLGEILDRTFSLYRDNFLLFFGITAIPQLFVLVYNFAQTALAVGPSPTVFGSANLAGRLSPGAAVLVFGLGLIGLLIYLVVYLFAQGGSFYAVSELYLGRPTSITACLRRMRGQAGNLLGVVILNGLAVAGGVILFVIPGIYIACRLLTCVPAALLEDLSPSASLSRSWELTRDNAGRAFVINLLYIFLFIVAIALLTFPFSFVAGLTGQQNQQMAQFWTYLSQVGNFFATVLVTPVLTIATAVFYFDLRVRKEAFDLQMMMRAAGDPLPSGPSQTPSIAS